jgi:hypothetical protein
MSEPKMKDDLKQESLEDPVHAKDNKTTEQVKEKEDDGDIDEQVEAVSLHTSSLHSSMPGSPSSQEKSSQEMVDALDEQPDATELSTVVTTLRESIDIDKPLPSLDSDPDGFESAMLEAGNKSTQNVAENGVQFSQSTDVDVDSDNGESLANSISSTEVTQEKEMVDHAEEKPEVKDTEDVDGDEDDQISVDSVPHVTVSEISEECSSISLQDDDDEEEEGSGRNSPQKLKVTDLKIATHFENVRKSIDGTAVDVQDIADHITLPPPGFAPNSVDRKATADGECSSTSQTNDIPIIDIDLSSVKANTLNPRLQEDYGKF